MKLPAIVAAALVATMSLPAAASDPVQTDFWSALRSLCGATYEGASVFPNDPKDSFTGKKLVAQFASCTEGEIRVPFAVGEDKSRTWIFSKTPQGLQLKHDHRHADGTPDKVTMYGGVAGAGGTSSSQAFKADAYTAKLIPEAATNVWTISLSPDGSKLIYYLERHAKPRFKAELARKAN